MSARIEELEEKLQATRAARAKAREAQYEIDLEARVKLEEEHGTIASVSVACFVAGQPTQAYLKTPTGLQYKKYKQQINSAAIRKDSKSIIEAGEALAQSCWLYPAPEAREAMLEAFPGLLSSMSVAATSLAEGKGEDEKNG